MFPEHLISIDDLTRTDVATIFNTTFNMEQELKTGPMNDLVGKIVRLLFFEPSTRTLNSSYDAVVALSGAPIYFSDPANQLSLAKKESIKDTARTFSAYPNCATVVIRHPDADFVREFAKYSHVPVINAGNGYEEHPTQGLLDLYTICQGFPQIKDLVMDQYSLFDSFKIAIVGDIWHSRTTHSLVKLLNLVGNKNIEVTFVAPESMQVPEDDAKQYTNLTIIKKDEIDYDILSNSQVIYMIRPQKERWTSEHEYQNCCLKPEHISLMLEDAMIMHPLPRNEELPETYDDDERAWYFQQEINGYYLRVALLRMMARTTHEFPFARKPRTKCLATV